MQRTGTDRRFKVIFIIIPIILFFVLVGIDQGTKALFTKLENNKTISIYTIEVIKDFFYFTYTLNEGSAYGFLSGKSWAQTFFKILTCVAMIIFILGFIFSVKNRYKVLNLSLVFIMSGTIGNFIDRLVNNYVVDFICVETFGRELFGVFNLADLFLTTGVIMAIVHFLFLDKNAIFKKK